jgi:hypothetical protein
VSAIVSLAAIGLLSAGATPRRASLVHAARESAPNDAGA